MQSLLYPQLVDDCESVVVSAPTGAGKTVVLELAIVRLLSKNPTAKAVYMVLYWYKRRQLLLEVR
jgi:ATP-dependent DNA helicase HFM1/MER3